MLVYDQAATPVSQPLSGRDQTLGKEEEFYDDLPLQEPNASQKLSFREEDPPHDYEQHAQSVFQDSKGEAAEGE